MRTINTVVATPQGKDYTKIWNGSLVRLYDRGNNGGNNIYILASYPRPDGGTAGLILIMLSTGACYDIKPMEAHFESALYVTLKTFAEHVKGASWEFVKSVTITGEDS